MYGESGDEGREGHYLIYVVLSQFKISRNSRLFSAKSVFQKFQSLKKYVFFSVCRSAILKCFLDSRDGVVSSIGWVMVVVMIMVGYWGDFVIVEVVVVVAALIRSNLSKCLFCGGKFSISCNCGCISLV